MLIVQFIVYAVLLALALVFLISVITLAIEVLKQ
jgi:hypothetical protein